MPRSARDSTVSGFFLAAMMFLKFGNRGSAVFSVRPATAGRATAARTSASEVATVPVSSPSAISGASACGR